MSKNVKKKLPKGWRWVRLGEVCDMIMGQSPPSATYRNVPEGLPFFQGKADFGVLHPIPRVWCVEPNKIALPGDILISVRAPVGPTNIANMKCCIGRGLAAIRCRPDVDRDFTISLLRHLELALVKKGTGSTFEAISRHDLEELEIPLPPLPTQQRLAARLNDQLATVERARLAAQAQLEEAKNLPAAYLRQVFPKVGEVLPEGWRWGRLGEVCDVIMGQSPEGTSYNSIGQGEALLNGPTEFGISHPTPVQWTTHPTRFAEKGDILLCVRGATTGRKNVADRRYCIGRGLAAIRGKVGICDTQFLIFVLELITKQILQESAGSTFPNIPREKLLALPISFPPLPTQQRLAARLNDQLAAVERLRLAAQAQLDEINALSAALLRQAFNGE